MVAGCRQQAVQLLGSCVGASSLNKDLAYAWGCGRSRALGSVCMALRQPEPKEDMHIVPCPLKALGLKGISQPDGHRQVGGEG